MLLNVSHNNMVCSGVSFLVVDKHVAKVCPKWNIGPISANASQLAGMTIMRLLQIPSLQQFAAPRHQIHL